MLTYDPDLRISARKALRHPFFKPLRDAEMRRENAYVLTSISPKFLKAGVDGGGASYKNLDDTTVTDQNNLSDYAGISQRTHKPSLLYDSKNKTNAFDRSNRLPGIKNPSIMDSNNPHNASISGSQDDSEGEVSHLPLPPIIKNTKLGTMRKPNGLYKEKHNTLKSEYSQQSLGGGTKFIKPKKFHEDLIKVDKAKIFKKTFIDNKRKIKKL